MKKKLKINSEDASFKLMVHVTRKAWMQDGGQLYPGRSGSTTQIYVRSQLNQSHWCLCFLQSSLPGALCLFHSRYRDGHLHP
jgi:hypothetical protein